MAFAYSFSFILIEITVGPSVLAVLLTHRIQHCLGLLQPETVRERKLCTVSVSVSVAIPHPTDMATGPKHEGPVQGGSFCQRRPHTVLIRCAT